MASDLPFYGIFAPQKIPLSKIYDDVIVCELWLPPPQSKILVTPTVPVHTGRKSSFWLPGY